MAAPSPDRSRDSVGRVTAVTILSPVRRVWALWLRLTWPAADRWPLVSRLVKRPLNALGFIDVAHWTLVPADRPPQLLFVSNFNDDPLAYIDAFSLVVPGRIRGMWLGADGFPGPRPVSRFESFIEEKWIPTSHLYCAYPEASARMVVDALAIREAHAALQRRAASLSDAELADAYRGFLAEVAGRL